MSASPYGTWEALRRAKIFLTGGSGFVGCWLLHVLFAADTMYELGASVTLLTRESLRFSRNVPELASDSRLRVYQGVLPNGPFPGNDFSDVVHAAAETNVGLRKSDSLDFFGTSVLWTAALLEWCSGLGIRRFSLASSGAVYARSALNEGAVAEAELRAPSTGDGDAAYGLGKRAAEAYAACYARRFNFNASFARLFSFVGPYLPLNSGFAVGNFVRDSLVGNRIVVSGDGTPQRTYLDGADMAVWYWTIHMAGRQGQAYNVGGEKVVSVAEVAKLVAHTAGTGSNIEISGQHEALRPVYVPDSRLAREELCLRETIDLDEAIDLALCWQRFRNMNL